MAIRNIADPSLANVTVPLAKAGRLHRLVDPDAGDTIMVVTAAAPVRGFIKRQDFVEMSLLESVHGVAIRPNSDDITVEITPDKIIGLVAEKADGIIPAMVTVEHTARMRAALVATYDEQAALLEEDRQARVEGRKFTGNVRLPNYQRSLHAVGFTDEDFNNGGSDRLVDAVVAWGSSK